jgi:hypothetical protein
MIGEFDFYGVFLPELLVWMLLTYCIQFVLTKALARAGFYRFVWHRSVFDLALYIVMLGLVVFVSHRLIN